MINKIYKTAYVFIAFLCIGCCQVMKNVRQGGAAPLVGRYKDEAHFASSSAVLLLLDSNIKRTW
jgi:hypothetical protein